MSRSLLARAAVWAGRGAVVVAALAASLAAAQLGPQPPFPTPRPAASAPGQGGPGDSPGKQPPPGSVDRVDLLIDRLDSATIHAPKLEGTLSAFRASHWRALPAPYARASGAARKAVHFLAFTVGGLEKKLDDSKKVGLGSAAELRTWNAAEASFDARMCLFAPPPAELRFPLRVPAGARFDFAPAAINLKAGSVTFEVALRPKGGERQVLDTFRVKASDLPQWNDRSVDLGAFAGREVELELATRTSMKEDVPSALWGEPAVVSKGPSPAAYNLVWFVVDTMRPDPLATWHDDERDQALAAAKLPAHEAWLPAMPTVAPSIDALARRGTAFVDATSAATWTRPGTLAMLAGARSSELGLDTTPWILPQATVTRFYASDPPLLPLLLRKAGERPQAFVNNFFLTGYARAGVDPGFSAMVDHRHETEDTSRIVRDTLAWVDKHQSERFFVFVNLNSPHSPYSPPERLRKRVPKPPAGPKDEELRGYLGEIAKDDEAIGAITARLDQLDLTKKTLVVVTADHGETLSRDHDVQVEGIGQHTGSTRYHHANAIFEETTRIPLVFSLPGKVPEGLRSKAPAQNIDIVPTVLDLLGLPRPEKVRGKSLVPYMNGAPPDLDRPIVSEGRAARSVRVGAWRYVERDPAAQKVVLPAVGPLTLTEELYDLSQDPGERKNVAAEHPEVVAKMRSALADALATSTSVDAQQSVSLAGSRHVVKDQSPPARVHVRFSGGPRPRRFTLWAKLADPEQGAPEPRLKVTPFQIDAEAIRVEGRSLDVAVTTSPSGLVGFDLEISPASTALQWDVKLDDQPLSAEQVFAGPYGLSAPGLLKGLLDADGKMAASAESLPQVDPRVDLGVFVTRDPSADVGLSLPGSRAEALGEVKQLLEAWGYAASGKSPSR